MARSSRNSAPKDNRRHRRPSRASEMSGKTSERKESAPVENPDFNQGEQSADHTTDMLASRKPWDSSDDVTPQRSLESQSDNKERRLQARADDGVAHKTDLTANFDNVSAPGTENLNRKVDASEKESE